MVRGNWQKRVETADARRKEAKQRKQRNGDKRQYKGWAHELLRNLDESNDRLRHDGKTIVKNIHVWTDTVPADGPPLLDLFDDQIESSSPDKTSRKGRGRSYSSADKGKKKAHPRSREEAEDKTESSDSPLLLCRSHFFTGTCEQSGRKKGACVYLHTSNQTKSLCQVANLKRLPRNRQHLIAAEAAVQGAVEDTAPDAGAMDMVYYLNIKIPNSQEEQDSSLSEHIVSVLSKKSVTLASVVYVAIEDTLVFDRYREGVILPQASFLTLLALDDNVNSRKLPVGSGGEINRAIAQDLPGTVLEHMLLFLPDESVSTASRVCKAWYQEIGQNSPNLWWNLLQRRNWPPPSEDADGNHRIYRGAFLRHYSVIRDAHAIQLGWNALESPRRNIATKEMAYQDFSSRKYAPFDPNDCLGVEVWGANQILAAYEHDCSLRLFEAQLKPDSNDLGCKELICQKVDPYRNTRKRHCRMLSIGVDDECIGSLCIVSTDSVDAVAYVLVVVNRDEFLLGESSDAAENPNVSRADLNVFDVGEAILNFVISNSDRDGSLNEVMEYLQEGGGIGSVEVLVSNQFAACGYGRFMLEVAVSIPATNDDADNDLRLIGRKLVLFSARVGSIVWMGDSVSLVNEPLSRTEEVTISSIRRPLRSSRSVCSIAVSPEKNPGSIALLEVDSSGNVTEVEVFSCPESSLTQLQEEGCAPANPFRTLLITPTHIVVADSFTITPPDGEDGPVDPPALRCKVVTSLVPRSPDSTDLTSHPQGVSMEGRILEVLQMSCIRDNYIVVVTVGHPAKTSYGESTDPTGDLAGQWFSPVAHDSGVSHRVEAWAVLLHIPSGREIGRQIWLANAARLMGNSHKFVMTTDAHETIALGLSWRGVAMTGNDVRFVGDSATVHVIPDDRTRSTKKKKKRKGNKSGKKDGFARGMSLRG